MPTRPPDADGSGPRPTRSTPVSGDGCRNCRNYRKAFRDGIPAITAITATPPERRLMRQDRRHRSGRLDWSAIRDTIDLAAVATTLLGTPPGRRGTRRGL